MADLALLCSKIKSSCVPGCSVSQPPPHDPWLPMGTDYSNKILSHLIFVGNKVLISQTNFADLFFSVHTYRIRISNIEVEGW